MTYFAPLAMAVFLLLHTGSYHAYQRIISRSITQYAISTVNYAATEINSSAECDKLDSRLVIRPVPSLEDVQAAVTQLQLSPSQLGATQTLRRKTGGYPNESVKDSIYLNLLASLKHKKRTVEERMSLKREIGQNTEDLKTFGLR